MHPRAQGWGATPVLLPLSFFLLLYVCRLCVSVRARRPEANPRGHSSAVIHRLDVLVVSLSMGAVSPALTHRSVKHRVSH